MRSVFSNKSLLNKFWDEYFLALIFARASKYANIVRLPPSFPPSSIINQTISIPHHLLWSKFSLTLAKVVVVLKCILISVHSITITFVIVIVIDIIIITIITIRLFLRVLGQLLLRVHSVKFGKNSPLKSGAGGLSTFPGDF